MRTFTLTTLISPWLAAAQSASPTPTPTPSPSSTSAGASTRSSTPQDSSAYHPHAAVAFIRSGERTPELRAGYPSLTPVGAQQMYVLGQNLRTRWITGSSPAQLGIERIAGLAPAQLDNQQVAVSALGRRHVVQAAQAFMQGLYPPAGIANGTAVTAGLLADGGVVESPLGGYQYPAVMGTEEEGVEGIYLAGHEGCNAAQRAAWGYYATPEFRQVQRVSRLLFWGLEKSWFGGWLDTSQLVANYAVEIADYLSYQMKHNATVAAALNATARAGEYDQIRQIADQDAWFKWGNASSAMNPKDANPQTMAGKTLASKMLGAFQDIIRDRQTGGDTADYSYPLTLMFGDYEPMVSLLSLLLPSTSGSSSASNAAFRNLPAFSSAIIFELFSTGNRTAFPTSTDNLWVRFHFHNGTGYTDNQLLAYPIFGNGPSHTDIPWREFEEGIKRFSVSMITEWCTMCQSFSLFCTGVDGTSSLLTPGSGASAGRRGGMAPALAGAIGAIVTLTAAMLFVALAALFAGVRVYRVPQKGKSQLGRFKGGAKLASDQDLSIAKNGALPAGLSFGATEAGAGVVADKRGHERVGSWELRQKEFGGAGESRRESLDGDGIDAVAARPVEPVERV